MKVSKMGFLIVLMAMVVIMIPSAVAEDAIYEKCMKECLNTCEAQPTCFDHCERICSTGSLSTSQLTPKPVQISIYGHCCEYAIVTINNQARFAFNFMFFYRVSYDMITLNMIALLAYKLVQAFCCCIDDLFNKYLVKKKRNKLWKNKKSIKSINI